MTYLRKDDFMLVLMLLAAHSLWHWWGF